MTRARTLLDGLHDVVEALAEHVGLAVLEEVQDAEAPSVEHQHVLQRLGNLALAHPALPIPQLGARPFVDLSHYSEKNQMISWGSRVAALS